MNSRHARFARKILQDKKRHPLESLFVSTTKKKKTVVVTNCPQSSAQTITDNMWTGEFLGEGYSVKGTKNSQRPNRNTIKD